jgi:hypothetical protein
VPLKLRDATHYRATCDACRDGYESAEVCCKRDSGNAAKTLAVEKLRDAGWHVDGLGTERERWYCPSCSKSQHL